MRSFSFYLFFVYLFLLPAASFCQSADARLEHMGVVGTLVYYKQNAETHALRIFNHKALPDSVKSLMITRYNSVRSGYEQLVLQLISDLQTRKRMFYFKRLDKCFQKNKHKKRGSLSYFLNNWQSIKLAYDTMISFPTQVYMDSMSSDYKKLHKEDELYIPEKHQEPAKQAPIKLDVLDPIGSIGSLFTIYRKLQFQNDQKATNITELLNTLRLRHASELVADNDAEDDVPADADQIKKNH